jgi:hypothetical protein
MRGKPLKMHEPHPSLEGHTVASGIIADLRDGLPKAHACARAEIETSTLNAWCDRGMTQIQLVLGFDAEHEGALDCAHRWGDSEHPSCTRCGTDRRTWDDLTAADAKWGDHVMFLRGVARAQADVMSDVIKALLASGKPQAKQALLDGEGNPIVIDGKVQTATPLRGDWRADAWWLERMDPKLFHLVTRAEEADIEIEPEMVPDAVMAEVAEIAERLGALDDDRS